MSTSTPPPLTNANLLINGGHRPRQSIIKSKTAHGSTMTITRSEKRCFIRYVNTIMNNAIQKAIEEKTKMQENGSWNFIMNTLSTTSTTEGDSANITSNGELTSPRGNNRRPRNVLLHLGDLAVIDYWKPMEVVGIEELESNVELFERLQDGVVFCHLLDKIQNGLVDWTKINKRNILTPLEELSKFQKVENQNFVLEVAPSVGCQIVGIGASELADGSQQPLLALLWQLIRQDVTKRLNVMHSLRLIALKEESESVVDFMKLPPQQLLLRFVNYNLKATKTKKIVANFSEDWKDGEAFCYLIKNIVDINNRFSSTKVSKNGNEFTEEQIQEILSIENHEERAKRIIQAINELGLNPNHVHIEGEDIATGVNTLIMTLVGSMFNATNLNGLQSELTEDPEKMTQLRREILDNFLEMMKDDMPEIKKPEMKVFLELVKKLSDVNIKEIEEKIVEQRVQEYKMEVRKLKKQHYVLFNQSEQYKRRIEELEKIVADQKVTIKDLEDKNAQQASRIQELEEELQKANHSRKKI
ncbi:hypothetical protein C9374_004143 [Naegleria lovaniensis]|uniref:Calponin-homology (CH) domain-containing protein n=1 Tax=Naegleria lovaniensis TaxID=51637 RepID=A0AA88GRY4_NAELO|nr:uncharacterized protein C9374_004143 [Naegleria lovaniensis]KAG2383472.1 hypothetical protein C9374_004143 [Naegleria lovaniensis]